MRNAIINGSIFDGEQLHEAAALILDGDRIISLVAGNDPILAEMPKFDLEGLLLVPGFVDIQVNGGGDVLFNDAPTVETIRTMGQAHRQFGTTGFLPTLVTTDIKTMVAAIEAVDAAIKENVPGVLGIHLEGPFLSRQFAGVHASEKFIELDDDTVKLVCSLKTGITLLTLAPECTTGERITQLAESGIVLFAGHSAATFEQAKSGIRSGITGFTHLFNAMSPFLSRAPGMVGAALEDQGCWVGIIADGIHIHPASFAITVAAKIPGKTLLVTDAMPSVGGSQSSFTLDGELITVKNGRCENSAGTLAGSDLNMITAVTNAMKFADLSLEETVRMASTYPAEAMGLGDQLGRILPGYQANFVALDDSKKVSQIWIDGKID